MKKLFTQKIVQQKKVLLFSFHEITLSSSNDLKKDLERVIVSAKKGSFEFIVDLSEVGYVTSLLIALLVFFLKLARKKGGDVKLCGFSKEAKDAFKIAKMEKVFEVYATQEEALASWE